MVEDIVTHVSSILNHSKEPTLSGLDSDKGNMVIARRFSEHRKQIQQECSITTNEDIKACRIRYPRHSWIHLITNHQTHLLVFGFLPLGRVVYKWKSFPRIIWWGTTRGIHLLRKYITVLLRQPPLHWFPPERHWCISKLRRDSGCDGGS